ncbi:DUF3965 domain-containing protein [Bacillus cytotoxicus]|uniref:DUF3965 domain-containing protein n=1 Tax=Bacillus cytotoxicus TaxID=580165 RepID=A0AAX2CBQ3_9BACI|nr:MULTISPECIES: DUF3965 domain-containing protein [Bacillus cereus group]QTR71742.1 DUF3965 domain-containing protein [Bacillus cytotoxicus]QTR83364.1 DUF3965 domain-containing protein [Bacillus cytotoxicus]QTR87101.1 DUF3965 domain-containing protein [Bacillus cytotoxicus]SCL82861.1 Uncharacterized protein BCB44BAC_00291 [Bacillus cytotoxicus]HDR4573566.1 DUF3965 domain-containing protein [Bacillus cytotoxicus]
MKAVQGNPNWNLVIDTYVEPKDFADLFSLLVPCRPKGEEKERTLLVWKEKEFYKEENLIPFILYGMNKAKELPQFHKDEIPTLVRIVRLCQEIGWYQEAYTFMVNQRLDEFVYTSREYETWDSITQIVALNYLIIKYRVGELKSEDVAIWNRVKFNEKCIEEYRELVSHKEVLEFTFFYLCKQAKSLSKKELNDDMMNLAIYCNTYLGDLYTFDLLRKYRKCTDFLSYYGPNHAVIACQRAVISQISDRLDPLKTTHVDDYLYVMKEMMEHMTIEIMNSYGHFIGKLLSYIPFFEMIQVPQHAYYCEELLHVCKGIEYKEEILRNYIFIQLHDCLPSFFRVFLKNKRYATIHDILFYWCDDEQRMSLEKKYNLSFIYEKYACG